MASETVVMNLIGFLYLFILGTNAASVGLGNRIDVGEVDAVEKLQTINENPNKFQQSIIAALISHFSILAIAGMLFLAFNKYNTILALIGTIFRVGEGIILSYNEIESYTLLNLAKEYAIANGTDKLTLTSSTGKILQKKNIRFKFGLNLLAFGTLAYIILFLAYEAIVIPIAWLGFVASVLSVIGTVIILTKPDIEIWYKIGLPLMMLFEITFGIWLLF